MFTTRENSTFGFYYFWGITSNINIDVRYGEDLQSYAGKHPAGLPQLLLYRAINFLAVNGFELKAGHIFITDLYNGLMQLGINRKTSVKCEGVGELTVKFSCDTLKFCRLANAFELRCIANLHVNSSFMLKEKLNYLKLKRKTKLS